MYINNTRNTSTPVYIAGGLFVAGYILFGLAASAPAATSKLGILCAFSGCALAMYSSPLLPRATISLILLYIFLAASWTWSPEQSINPLGNYATALMGGILVSKALELNWISAKQLILLLLLIPLANIAAYLAGINIVEASEALDPEVAFRRFGGVTGHPNALANRMLLPIFFFCFFSSHLRPGFQKMTIGILCLGTAFAAAYMTGSKKSLLILLPMLPFWYSTFTHTFLHRHVLLLRWIIGFIFFAMIAALFTYTAKQDFAADSEVVNRVFNALGNDDESTSGRLELLYIGSELFIIAPIFGSGFNSFATLSGAGYYSHNNYVELLVSGGIVAFSLYLYAITSILQNAQKIVGSWKIFSLIAVFLSLDFTGVSFTDRSSQIMLLALSTICLPKKAV